MSCLRLLTALVALTGVACWTAPFNWHFLPKHYMLYSNLTADHVVQFDTDCGTLAADSDASHFLWDPESGLCSVSTGLTAADSSVVSQQDLKAGVYYVRDFALVVPPGSPNCPTEVQLKRMIDNLLLLNGSFTAEPDPSRRTWRDKCKKSENVGTKDATTTASTASPTNSGTAAVMKASSITTPDVTTDPTSPSTPPSTKHIRLATTDSWSTSPATSTKSTTLSSRTPAVPPAAPLPMTDNLNPASSATSQSPVNHGGFSFTDCCSDSVSCNDRYSKPSFELDRTRSLPWHRDYGSRNGTYVYGRGFDHNHVHSNDDEPWKNEPS